MLDDPNDRRVTGMILRVEPVLDGRLAALPRHRCDVHSADLRFDKKP